MHFDKFDQEDLLIDKEKLAQLACVCLICHQLLKWPVHCLGCHSEYCRQCAFKWKKENNTCPLRCTMPWLVAESEPKGIELKCPVGPSCDPVTPQVFEEHLKECLRERLRRGFLCFKGHKLAYMTTARQIVCADCGKQALSRSVCLTCKELGETFLYYYCTRCRKPPLTKKHCPVSHEFVHTILKDGFVCNLCEQSSSKRQLCYKDKQCNFAVCESCHSRIPTTLPQGYNNSICF